VFSPCDECRGGRAADSASCRSPPARVVSWLVGWLVGWRLRGRGQGEVRRDRAAGLGDRREGDAGIAAADPPRLGEPLLAALELIPQVAQSSVMRSWIRRSSSTTPRMASWIAPTAGHGARRVDSALKRTPRQGCIVFWVGIIVFSLSLRFGGMMRNRGLLRSVLVAVSKISNLNRQLAVARFDFHPHAFTKSESPEPFPAKPHHRNVTAALPQLVDRHALQSW